VGGGSKVRFSHDLCCGDMTLKEAFPVLFGIARIKDTSIGDSCGIFGRCH
jgi:hypothetical protein